MRATAYHSHATTQGRKCAPSAPRPRPVGVGKPDGKARVPETAILRGGEVSPAAFRLYCYYCARRNNESGGWRVKNREAAEALDLSRSRVSEARKELLGEGWIVDLGADFITPLMGFEAVEDSTEGVENSNADVENSNESVENSTLLIDKDRARGFTSYVLPTLLPTHTPTPRETPSASVTPTAARSAAAGVRVSLVQSRLDFAQVLAWTTAQKGAGAKIDPYAVAVARHRDGTADDYIAAWLETRTPEAVERVLFEPPPRERMTFQYAAKLLRSMLQGTPHLNIASEVSKLDVSDEDGARLLDFFTNRQAAATASPNTGAAHSTAETPHTIAQR